MNDLSFPILTNDRYQTAYAEAENNARKHIHKPDFNQFSHAGVQMYPTWFSRLIGGLLIAVLVFSFWVSAGKQIATAGMVLDDLPGDYSHLSTLWSSIGIVAALLLSEAGAVFFLIVAGTLTNRSRVGSLIVRLFAVLCAGIAVIANVTITSMHPINQALAYQWLITVGVPLIVLGLGYVAEQIVVNGLRARAEQTAAFNVAMVKYEQLYNDPTVLPDWGKYLGDSLWRELNRYKDTREMLLIAGNDPGFKTRVLTAEYQSQKSGANFLLAASNVPKTIPDKTPGETDETAQERATRWLMKQDETRLETMSISEMADGAGVSRSTMFRAKRSYGKESQDGIQQLAVGAGAIAQKPERPV